MNKTKNYYAILRNINEHWLFDWGIYIFLFQYIFRSSPLNSSTLFSIANDSCCVARKWWLPIVKSVSLNKYDDDDSRTRSRSSSNLFFCCYSYTQRESRALTYKAKHTKTQILSLDPIQQCCCTGHHSLETNSRTIINSNTNAMST